jgi:hypothetical protein
MPVPAAPPVPERYLWLCPACLRVRLGEAAPDACRCGQRPQWERYPEALWRDTARLGVWYGARRQRFLAEQRAHRELPRGAGTPPAPPAPAADPLAAQRDDWLARLKRSPYASFFANAHQFLSPADAPEG